MSMMQAVEQQIRRGTRTTSARLGSIEAQPKTPDRQKKLERLLSGPVTVTSSVIACDRLRRLLTENGYWEFIRAGQTPEQAAEQAARRALERQQAE